MCVCCNSRSPAIIITIIIFVRSFFYFGQILLHSNPLSQLCVLLLRSHPQFFATLLFHLLGPYLMPFIFFRPTWLAVQFMLANCQWWIRTNIYSAIEQCCEHTAHTLCSTICGAMFTKGNTTATTTTTLPERASHNTCWLGADIVSYLIIMIDWIWMWNTLFRSTVVMRMTMTTAAAVAKTMMVEMALALMALAEFSAVHSTPSALLRALQSFFFVWYH